MLWNIPIRCHYCRFDSIREEKRGEERQQERRTKNFAYIYWLVAALIALFVCSVRHKMKRWPSTNCSTFTCTCTVSLYCIRTVHNCIFTKIKVEFEFTEQPPAYSSLLLYAIYIYIYIYIYTYIVDKKWIGSNWTMHAKVYLHHHPIQHPHLLQYHQISIISSISININISITIIPIQLSTIHNNTIKI